MRARGAVSGARRRKTGALHVAGERWWLGGDADSAGVRLAPDSQAISATATATASGAAGAGSRRRLGYFEGETGIGEATGIGDVTGTASTTGIGEATGIARASRNRNAGAGVIATAKTRGTTCAP